MSSVNEIYEILKGCETQDYQRRKGNYPKNNIPDSIEVYENEIICSFKNTTEKVAADWLKSFLKRKNIKISMDDVFTSQDGDYTNDWVQSFAKICDMELA